MCTVSPSADSGNPVPATCADCAHAGTCPADPEERKHRGCDLPAAIGPPSTDMSGRRIWRDKETGCIFIALPEACHQPTTGHCDCDVCKKTGETGAWDTLVIDPKGEYTRLVHFPVLRHVGLLDEYTRSRLETVIS